MALYNNNNKKLINFEMYLQIICMQLTECWCLRRPFLDTLVHRFSGFLEA